MNHPPPVAKRKVKLFFEHSLSNSGRNQKKNREYSRFNFQFIWNRLGQYHTVQRVLKNIKIE